MITVLLIIKNDRDSTIFSEFFRRLNAKVITCSAIYSSYLKALQYDPDVVIVEFPDDSRREYCNFLKVIRNNKSIEQKPLLLFGNEQNKVMIDELVALGMKAFLKKPIVRKILIEEIRQIISSKAKSRQFVDKNQTTPEEITALKNSSISVSEKISIVQQHVTKLLAFPATVANILRVSQNAKSGATDLADIIKTDPSVLAEILKVANSVFFARGGKRILDVKEAVVRIGFMETKTIAMSLSVYKIMLEKNYQTGFNHTEFWFHSLAVAVISEWIAKNSNLAAPDEAFIAGLLHDIGLLILNEYFNTIFLEILEKTTSEGNPFLFCEEQIIGFSHNEFVRDFFADWNFPDMLVQAIPFFSQPESLTADKMQACPLATIVSISDIIAKSLQIGRDADCCVAPIPSDILSTLRLPYGLQRSFIDTIYNQLNLFNQILHIDKKTFPHSNDLIKNAEMVNLLCYSFTNEQYNPVFEYLKTQRYTVAVATSLDDVRNRAHEFNAIILTDLTPDNIEQAAVLDNLKVLSFPRVPAGTLKDDIAAPDLVPAKMLVFNPGQPIELQPGQSNSIVSRFPVDLRNIDMVLACLLMDQVAEVSYNELGSFKVSKKIDFEGNTISNQKALIVHTRGEIRKRVIDGLTAAVDIMIEEASTGDTAVNLAKTMKEELLYVFIDLRIPVVRSADVVKQIMELPNQKKAKYAVIFSRATKEELIPFVKLGIRVFISEDYTQDVLLGKIKDIVNSGDAN